jgi:hypothetical protein
MEREAWRVLRFRASEVVANSEGVAAAIARAPSTPPHPTSPPRGERSLISITYLLMFLSPFGGEIR